MSRRATIHDVAAAAGVSVATVSKAVNGRYGVASTTVTRVLDAVAELGYESSLVASSMRSRRTGVIGVLVSDFEPFSAEVLKGVGAALRDHRYDLLAYSGSRDRDPAGWERRSLSRLSGTLIDAAIMVTPTIVGVPTDIPIVAVDPHAGRVGIPSVESDSLAGAFEATSYLIELGHRRIGFLAGRPELRSSELREAGYRRALSQAGIAFDPRLVAVGMYDPDTVRSVSRPLLQQADRPTAVFAANDRSALGLIEVATDLGLDVPGDLSVVGFDDIPEAFLSARPLSTVRQPMMRLGAEAARLVVALLGGTTPEVTQLILPTRLITRSTTAPPRR
ncbi:MAG: LacI family DNA-binding transcriptional regulator [Microbacterium sp.]|uniref:LacI family DNA-binding transcriptional regulator n=1 Tax=Microbacterium sp. TaxID=51671 RepID=UPI001AC29191|nr:LacI family DNA-binding transcriptional regulator [Microbacterium sp.]MBN9177652.1 LacI family DNA-binding transcriptional regulator [Microbacterium sp.]